MAESRRTHQDSNNSAEHCLQLYLHPLHLQAASRGRYHPVQPEMLPNQLGPIDKFTSEGVRSDSIGDLPKVHLEGQRLVVYDGDASSCIITSLSLLLAEVKLSLDTDTGLLVLLVAAATCGDAWLVLVDGGLSAGKQALTALGEAGAIRSDFFNSYSLAPEPLGSGSNAEVYTVTRKTGDSPGEMKMVAKVALPNAEKPAEKPAAHLTATERIPRDIQQEVAMLTAVQGHPHIVRFHGLFSSDGSEEEERNGRSWALAMELCSGGDLFDAVCKGRFEEDRARTVVCGLLSALAHVHRRGIVHRDVKPENMLLATDGRPVLADFGIACRVEDEKEMARRCGSPGYAAPEVLSGKPYGMKVDCFSSGSLLFFLICSKVPFDGPSVASMLRRTERCNVDFRISTRFQNVSDVCKEFILSLLRKNSEERISSSEALQHPWVTEEEPDKLPSRECARAWAMFATPGGAACSSSSSSNDGAPGLPAAHTQLHDRESAVVKQRSTPTQPMKSDRIFSNLPTMVAAAVREGDSFSTVFGDVPTPRSVDSAHLDERHSMDERLKIDENKPSDSFDVDMGLRPPGKGEKYTSKPAEASASSEESNTTRVSISKRLKSLVTRSSSKSASSATDSSMHSCEKERQHTSGRNSHRFGRLHGAAHQIGRQDSKESEGQQLLLERPSQPPLQLHAQLQADEGQCRAMPSNSSGSDCKSPVIDDGIRGASFSGASSSSKDQGPRQWFSWSSASTVASSLRAAIPSMPSPSPRRVFVNKAPPKPADEPNDGTRSSWKEPAGVVPQYTELDEASEVGNSFSVF
eukprot:CAMPEP_0179097846 /NCGR_PEP_ID=MMETSP0796-20121207/45056_1 /TAXON_ID=73915 /ORGANISM="Pyrodinium bahamense, Strain pbaha01" /LENGTH=804 /DNA_ID=CAMNT_0020795601 /DNA_START=5 /DNA_END=2417 /DNA_ORIENTATION=-